MILCPNVYKSYLFLIDLGIHTCYYKIIKLHSEFTYITFINPSFFIIDLLQGGYPMKSDFFNIRLAIS